MRLGFLGAVLATLVGVWVVAGAHLDEQFLGAPHATVGLIDPNAGKSALTPEYIERQILAFSLRLREDELTIPAGTDPRPRPFRDHPRRTGPLHRRPSRQTRALSATPISLTSICASPGWSGASKPATSCSAATMTIPEVAQALQTALFEEVVVTIPEGFRAEEIAERLAANNVIDADRFLTAVRLPRTPEQLRRLSVPARPAPGRHAGRLSLPRHLSLPRLRQHARNWCWRPSWTTSRPKWAKTGWCGGSSGLSGRNLVILASIVEREAVQADERPLIAGVYINRLNGVCAAEVGGNYLQADPTVQYARGTVGNWWWKPQSIEEYAPVISPYNTYLYPGLPPGPIASPGLSAIESTRNPAASNYCFFVATGDDGRHVFAQTLAEHQQNLQIYGYNP